MADGAAGKRGVAMPDSQQDTLSLLDYRESIFMPDPEALDSLMSGEVLPCATLRDVLTAHPSPFTLEHHQRFVSDDDKVELQAVHFASRHSAGHGSHGQLDQLASAVASTYQSLPRCAIRAGPRETIYVTPSSAHIAIVTVGGLCPGLNDVIRGIVLKALDYGVPESHIIGVRYGFKGFYSKTHRPIVLDRAAVDDIQLEGGTVLGTSRDPPHIMEIVKRLDLWKIDQLFVIGGPGGHAAALSIQQECGNCHVPCSVIAVPKSIDNDILLVDRAFGFETAVEEAQAALMAAKVEATSGYRGVGLVRLMGRRSGFIAVQASLASGLVDACLIPEVPFRLDSLAAYLEAVLERKGHAVVCVAEGAAQDLITGGAAPAPAPGKALRRASVDGSGQPTLKDVGLWLKGQLRRALTDVDVKYIDPSYLIRSVPARSNDRVVCRQLAHGAVHGAFAGFTGVSVGLVNTHFVYLPIPLLIQAPRRVDPHGELWNRLRGAIGQPDFDQPPPQPGGLATERGRVAAIA